VSGRPIAVAVAGFDDAAADRLVEDGFADAILRRPLLRAEVEDLLTRIASGSPMQSEEPRRHGNRLRHSQAIVFGERIDLDDDLSDRSARRLAATDRFHPDESCSFEFRQGPREVGLGTSRHLHQFRNRTRLTIPNQREQPSVLGRQQADQSLDRVETRLRRICRG
jgi:hypothetical protein